MKRNEDKKKRTRRHSFKSEMQWMWAGFDPTEDIWTGDDVDDLGMIERPE